MKRFSVELALPPLANSSNVRGHSRRHAKDIAAYRKACQTIYDIHQRRGELPKRFRTFPVCVDLEYFLFRHPFLRQGRLFPKDEFNGSAGAKTAIDALQDAGLVPNDSADFIKQGKVDINDKAEPDHPRYHQKRCCLVISLTEPE